MKTIILLGLLVFNICFAATSEKMVVNFKDEEITKVIEMYSKASGQKFIVDSTVRGKVTLFNQQPIGLEEAFNDLSTALALNGYAIIKQGDTMVVRSARSAQRDYLEASTVVPSLAPQRLYTWIYTPKYVSAQAIMRDVRVLTSSYGEMSSSGETNQLVITDWTPNIVRVAEILKLIDHPVDANTKKIVDADNKKNAKRHKEMHVKKGDKAPPIPEDEKSEKH
jgi:type II secretory pathway component GspD/PulD (secretin)